MDEEIFRINLKKTGLTLNDMVELFHSAGYLESGIKRSLDHELVRGTEKVHFKPDEGMLGLISQSETFHEAVYDIFKRNYIFVMPRYFADKSGSQTQIGQFLFHDDGRICYKGMLSEIKLSRNDYALVRLFAENSDRDISIEDIADAVSFIGKGQKLRNKAGSVIYSLKEKLEQESGLGDTILTLKNKGYCLNKYLPVKI
jgi:DNA-binding winged helix-turn-helix (wHTH) protein